MLLAEQVFDRRSAAKLYCSFAAEHGVVNCQASYWQTGCDVVAGSIAMQYRTGGRAMPQSLLDSYGQPNANPSFDRAHGRGCPSDQPAAVPQPQRCRKTALWQKAMASSKTPGFLSPTHTRKESFMQLQGQLA